LGPAPALSEGGKPRAAARTKPAAATPKLGCDIVPTLRGGWAEYTVRVSPGVMSGIERELAEREAGEKWRDEAITETGGWLYSQSGTDEREAWIDHATGPGADATHLPGSLRLSPPETFENEWPDAMRERLELVGQWHTHPGTYSGQPSTRDLEAWSAGAFRRSHPLYVALIATPGDTFGFQCPTLHGWVVRWDADELVCEPARVLEV
jgi:hypothetical protein